MKKAFTFIEILVVLGIISLALPALFAIIITIFQQETRIYALKDVKQQGDYALENIKFTIQQQGARIVNSAYQDEVCPLLTSPTPTPASHIYVMDHEQNTFTYYINSYKIASESSIGTFSFLTNSRVVISNFGYSCYKTNTFSPPIVVASFDVTSTTSNITLPYRTTFQLRSY